MRKLLKPILLVFCICFTLVCCTKKNTKQRPRLVVGIVVDQLKQDYILRYRSKLSTDGFSRFENEGFVFKNAHYNYIPTVTGAGHASIFCGTTPSDHGIIENDWYNRHSGLKVYCVGDTTVSAVGGNIRFGQRSPKNLRATTIGDSWKLAQEFKSKVIGIAIKDRGAILPAGHSANAAYWFDGTAGNFMTSTYYMEKLPAWVEVFNQKKLAIDYLQKEWNTLLPITEYTESADDDTEGERPLYGKTNPVFPYDLKKLSQKSGIELIKTTPYGNDLIFDFAEAAIQEEQLGESGLSDLLTISLSSIDYIGHSFGDHSIEMQDAILRLDFRLASFLKFLDERFGDDYLVFLTSDHAVAPLPDYLKKNKIPAKYMAQGQLLEAINSSLQKKYGEGDWISDFNAFQIYLHRPYIENKKIAVDDVANHIKSFLLKQPEVEKVYLANALKNARPDDRLMNMLANGFYEKRSGDIFIQLAPHMIGSFGRTQGTTHGTGYNYDTHVPILFLGKDVPKGNSVRQVFITDIAATVSLMTQLPLPSTSKTDNPLKELFQ